MKKIKNILLILCFLSSLITLYWVTGDRTPWNNLITDKSNGGISIYLGDIPNENYDRMGFAKGIVKYIESEDGWLVGNERGELFLFSNNGDLQWKHSLGIGKLTSICISNDSKIAFVGEQSQSGYMYAVNVNNGDILWKHAAIDFIGVDTTTRSYPSVVHIAVDDKDTVFANIYRFSMGKDGTRNYYARMVAIDKYGDLLWKFPDNEVIDCWINWCDVNSYNGKVVISTSAYDFRKDMKYKDTIYMIEKDTGKLLNSVYIPPVEPFDNTVMRGSPNFSQDGKYLAACCSDGRAILMDHKGKILWSRTLSKPTQVDGAWINASGRDGYGLDNGVAFTTINTFNRENWQLPTPVEHPSNNSIFMFNYDGSYRYQYMADGTMEELAFADGKIACAIGRNVRTHNYQAHGALILSEETGEKLSFYHTDGPLQAISISNDGKKIAGIEVPAVTPDGKIIGMHRLHIWKYVEGD